MSSHDPLISVVMPVYNSDEYLAEAIDSILNQTFRDFEFIIVCDDPSLKTREIIDNYQKNDTRIIVFYQKKEGLVESLNKGCSVAKGKYIARMDADDISLPKRLEKQVAFMDANPEIGVCGTWLETIGHNKEVWTLPTIHEDIVARMLFETHNLHHPTVIIRKDIILTLQEFYNEDFKHAEDAEYWMRLVNLGVKFANIGEIFLKYRVHENNISNIHHEMQKKNADRILSMQLLHLGIESTKEKYLIFNILKYGTPSDVNCLEKVSKYIEILLKVNQTTNFFSEPSLSRELARRWFILCNSSTRNGLSIWYKYHEKFISGYITLSYKQKGKFLLKCILRINRLQDLLNIVGRNNV